MLVVKDKKRAKLFIALFSYVLIVLMSLFLLKDSTVEIMGIWRRLFVSLGLFLVLPLVLIKYTLKESPKDYLLNFDKKTRKKAGWMLLAIALMLFLSWLFVIQLGQDKYIKKTIWEMGSTRIILMINFLILPWVVLSQEFFFRGFLLETARRNLGLIWAILLQAVLFTGFQFLVIEGGFNWLRMGGYLIAGSLLGYIAYRNKSIVISGIVYWAYLFFIDMFLLYRISQLMG